MKQVLFVILGLLVLAIAAFFAWPEKAYEPYQVSAAYLAQVEDFTIPDMPDDWVWASFEAEDGTNLRWGQTGNAGAAHTTVLMIPGYTATMSMYGEQVGEIAARGYHVVGLDLRGQGGSDRAREDQPEKLLIGDFRTYVEDVAAFIETLDVPEDRPIILFGMSFGGHVAFRVAGEHAGAVDGLMLLAPALQPKAGDMSFEQVSRLLKLGDMLGKDTRYLPGNSNWFPYSEENLRVAGIEHCASSPERLPMRDAIFTRFPEQRVGGVTFDWGGAFYKSSEFVLQPGYAEAITLPVSMIHAELDTFVMTDVNKTVCEDRLANCASIPLAGSGHCLLQETDPVLDAIYDALDDLSKRLIDN